MELDIKTDPPQYIWKCALQITKLIHFMPLTACQFHTDEDDLKKGLIFISLKYINEFKATRLSSQYSI
jgi:glucokinase